MAATPNQTKHVSSKDADGREWSIASDHAWRYFELHANQRMAVFNFFTVLAGLITAGIGITFQRSQAFAAVGVALGMLLAGLAFVFWKLDQRAAFFVKHAEKAQTFAERHLPEPVRVFTNEPTALEEHRERSSFFLKPWTFGSSFRVVFVVAAVIGLSAAAVSGLRWTGAVQWSAQSQDEAANGIVLAEGSSARGSPEEQSTDQGD